MIRKYYNLDEPVETDCVECPRTTWIKRFEVTVIDCGTQLHNDLCDLWNSTRCSNDECYCNPFIEGDKIYLQFHLPIPLTNWFNLFGQPKPIGTVAEWNTEYFAALVDENGDIIPAFNEISTFASSYGMAVDPTTGKPFVWLVIDTEMLNGLCYFNLIIGDEDFRDVPIIQIENKFYSEPYCCVKCDHPTILVRGTYNKYDAFGHYYGDFVTGSFTGDPNGYIAEIRVYGNIERINNQIEKIETDDVPVSSEITPVYLLRTEKLPLYVVDLLTVALAGQQVFIDGVEYESPTSVDKNNEEGSMWLVESQIEQKIDKTNFECDL